jgi:hypothetical protein
MRAYLIDAFAKEVKEIEYKPELGYKQTYDLLSTPVMKVDCFDLVQFNKAKDAIFVDDTGLCYDGEVKQEFFTISGYPSPLAGNGLVTGLDEKGDIAPPTVSLKWLQANISFLSMDEAFKQG